MGLFGLFYTAFALGTRSITNIKNCIENENRRQNSIHRGKETYIDERGCERLVSNNQKVIKTYIYKKTAGEEYKDYVLKVMESNEIIRNYSEEERNKEENLKYNQAIANDKTTYRLGSKNDHYLGTAMPGYRYKDIKTGDIYVIRVFNGARYYMNIKNGEIVRMTDGQLKAEKDVKAYKHNHDDYEKMRIKINKEQQEYLKTYGSVNERSNYCNMCGGDLYED